MRAVKPEDIAKVLYREYGKAFREAKRQGQDTVAISYSTFEATMIKTGTLNDPATIRTKWRALISMGIIHPRDPNNAKYGKADINLAQFDLLRPIPTSAYDEREIEIRDREIDMCLTGEGF